MRVGWGGVLCRALAGARDEREQALGQRKWEGRGEEERVRVCEREK